MARSPVFPVVYPRRAAALDSPRPHRSRREAPLYRRRMIVTGAVPLFGLAALFGTFPATAKKPAVDPETYWAGEGSYPT